MPSERKAPISGAARALGALVIMNLIWGANFPFIKPALERMPPFTFTLLRFVTAMAALLPLAGREALRLLRGPDRGKIIAMGLLGLCLAQVSQTLALKLSTASDISLMAATSPLWVALLASVWLGERFTRGDGLGLALSVAGLLLIFWPRQGGALEAHRIAGDAIFMVTGFSWACYNVIGKSLMDRLPALATTTAAGIVGTIALVPFAVYEWAVGQPVGFSLQVAGSIAYAGLLVTALGFIVLLWALKRVTATQAGAVMYVQPLAGVLISWALLGERLVPSFFAGAALVLAGVGVISRAQARGGSAKRVTDRPGTAAAGTVHEDE